jgi:cbb3-type cytochrome oxidase maturation protein
MTIIYLLIGCSVVIAAVFLGLFLWSVRSGQYDDPETPAIRMLFDNPLQANPAQPTDNQDDGSQFLK